KLGATGILVAVYVAGVSFHRLPWVGSMKTGTRAVLAFFLAATAACRGASAPPGTVFPCTVPSDCLSGHVCCLLASGSVCTPMSDCMNAACATNADCASQPTRPSCDTVLHRCFPSCPLGESPCDGLCTTVQFGPLNCG